MRLVPIQSLSAEQTRAWERLAQRAIEPNPFFEPDFVLAAFEALGGDVQLLVAESDGEWIGCLPVQPLWPPGRRIALSSWRHHYGFLGVPLVDRDRCRAYAEALAEAMRRRRPTAFLAIRHLNAGKVLDSIREAAADAGISVVYERSFERAAVRRREDGEYLGHMKSKRRSELKRLRRRLGEELGGEVVTVEETGSAEAAERFLELEASGWKGRAGTAMASSPSSAALLRRLSERFGADGRFLLRSLKVGERTVAMATDFCAGETCFGFKTAYDEELQRFSPGVLLHIDGFTAFHERGREALLDSCAEADNDSVNSLMPDRVQIVTIGLGPAGPLGCFAGRLIAAGYSPRGRELVGGLRRFRASS